MIDGMVITPNERAERCEMLLKLPTVTVEEAALILGMGRTAAYEAARRGDIPTFKVGRVVKVPTARLKAMLGMGETE